jgi:hypothetical protein
MRVTERELAALLKRAAEAHHEYEAGLGSSDPNWAEWYAHFIAEVRLKGGDNE